MWVAGLSGGLLSVPFLWWLDVPRHTQRGEGSPVNDAGYSAYVDRDGWMLTPEDAAALTARPPAP